MSAGRIVTACTALVLGLMIPAIADAEPDRDAIRGAIVERLEDGLTVEEFRFRTFVSQDPSRGRVSVSGTLKISDDRIQRLKNQSDTIHAELLRDFGIPKDRAIAIGKMIGWGSSSGAVTSFNFFTVEQPRNTLLPFTAELSFLETVDGFSFENRLIYDVCCELASKILADPRNYLYRGPEYQQMMEVFNEWWAYEKGTLPMIANALFAPLEGARILYEDGTEVARLSALSLGMEPWSPSTSNADNRPGTYNAMRSTATVTITPVRNFGIANAQLSVGQGYRFELALVYPYEMERLDQTCLSMKSVDHWYSTQTVCFDGAGFSWNRIGEHGGISDFAAGQRLEIRY